MQDELIVGIDLGTTFSLVACADERGARVLRDEHGDGRVPSVLGVTPDPAGGPPRLTIGWEARRHAIENACSTVYSIKRLIGRSLTDITAELPFLAYAVAPGPRDSLRVEIDGRLYSPEEISAAILRALRERAESQLGRPVRKAVITVPAYFDDAQRQATRDAAGVAGLEVARIINEPTAAALAYGIGLRGAPAGAAGLRAPDRARMALPLPHCNDASGAARGSGVPPKVEAIRDPASGQRARCVAIFDLGGGTFDLSVLRIEDGAFQVLATKGDTHLGGDDFDRLIIGLVQDEVRAQLGADLDAPAMRQALRTLAEAAKVRLSERTEAEFELDLGGGRVYRRTVTRAEFERLAAPLVERATGLCRGAIGDAGLALGEIDEIVLVGGATRMPLIRRRVEELFGRAPYTALNPDEVVALGAAVQAALIGGAALDMLLLDVTPLSLGIETMGGGMGKLIVRNTTIPCRATEQFTTFVDGQTAIQINVLQGERELARDCRSLGEFELRGIPPMPAGIPKVEVEFLIDANGILNVAAREVRSGCAAQVQIFPNRGLARDEVERMVRESQAHGAADIAAHRRIDLVNQVEFDVAKTREMLARVGDQLPPAERARLEAEMLSLQALACDTTDLDALHRALQDFGRGTLRLAELGIRAALRSAPGA